MLLSFGVLNAQIVIHQRAYSSGKAIITIDGKIHSTILIYIAD